MDKRTAREINVKEELKKNKNITVKIGTVENRNFPDTVYIIINFWTKPKKQKFDRNFFEKLLKNNIKLKKYLNNNNYFPFDKENIFIYNIPENFNYNEKLNFISIEIYLHTINAKSGIKTPLNSKKNTELFFECVKISNIVEENINELENFYIISKKSKLKIL